MTKFDLAQAAATILQRNAFYRLLQREPPPVVYQSISQLAQQQLRSLLLEKLQQDAHANERWDELSAIVLAETWQAILGEAQLKALAIHVQQQQPGTLSFQKAIDVLLRAFALSKRLKKRPAAVSEEAYREAQNMLQLWICKNIHNFNSERGELIKWINFRFDRTYLVQPPNLKRSQQFGDLVDDYDLDRIPSAPLANFDSNLLDWLQEDYIFRIPNRDKPDITFLDIALARIKNQQWQDIADHFGFNRLTTPRNFLTNWLNNLTMPLIAGQASSTLYKIRLARFDGESWTLLSARFQVDEMSLKAAHQNQLKQFPSYRDVTRSDRYNIPIPDHPDITFANLARILLESGHLWQAPATQLRIEPMKLKDFYFSSLLALWPRTRPIDRS